MTITYKPPKERLGVDGLWIRERGFDDIGERTVVAGIKPKKVKGLKTRKRHHK